MLTATIQKDGNEYHYTCDCRITGTTDEGTVEKLRINRNTIRCPRFTGKDCSSINFKAHKNEHTQTMFRDNFIQLRSPTCIPDKKVSPDWKDYTNYLNGLISKEKDREVVHLDDEDNGE